VSESKQRLSKQEKKIQELIDVSFKYQEKESWLENGKRLLESFKGRYYGQSGDSDRYTYNSIFSAVNLMLPNLILYNPKIKAKPVNPRYMRQNVMGDIEQVNNIRASATMEAAVNHEYRHIRAVEEDRFALQDALFWGFGIKKIGYSYKTEMKEEEEFIKEDTAFIKRVAPRDFGFHPMATTIDDSPVLIHRLVTTKEQLEANENFTNAHRVKPSVPKHLKDKIKEVTDSNFVTLWEVHDQEHDLIYTFGGEDKILLWKRENPYHFSGSHFSMIRFSHDPDEFIGIPLLAQVEDESDAMNLVITMMMHHIEMFPGQLIYQEGALDELDIEKIQRSGQGAIIGVKDITQIIKQPPITMGNDYFNVFGLLQSNLDRTTAIPDFRRAAQATRKTASEASFIQADVNAQREWYAGKVKAFMLDGIEKMSYLMAQFYDNKRFIMSEGQVDQQFIEYTKEDIQGEYQFDFDIDTMRAMQETQAQQLINGLNIIASHPGLQPILQSLDPLKIGTELFKKLGMNIEAFQRKDIERETFIDPNKENLIALEPQNPKVQKYKGIIPDPKQGENQDEHLLVHTEGFEIHNNPELYRHIMLHQQLKESQDVVQPQQGAGPQPVPTTQQQGGTGGPQQSGPVNM